MAFHEAIKFSAICTIHMFHPNSYNPAMITVLIKQIYFTTIQLLPLFFFMAVLFGSTIIGAVIYASLGFGLEQQIGSIIVTFTVDEFAPLFTALLIALRSGAAVNTEIASMNVNKEIRFLQEYGINLYNYLYLPRIISGIISMTSLSLLFALVMILSGYIFTFLLTGMGHNTYASLIFSSLEVKNFLFLLIKSVIYGFVVMLIPIYSGMKAKDSFTQIPIAVLNGMMKLFIAIFLVEGLSLVLQFI